MRMFGAQAAQCEVEIDANVNARVWPPFNVTMEKKHWPKSGAGPGFCLIAQPTG